MNYKSFIGKSFYDFMIGIEPYSFNGIIQRNDHLKNKYKLVNFGGNIFNKKGHDLYAKVFKNALITDVYEDNNGITNLVLENKTNEDNLNMNKIFNMIIPQWDVGYHSYYNVKPFSQRSEFVQELATKGKKLSQMKGFKTATCGHKKQHNSITQLENSVRKML